MTPDEVVKASKGLAVKSDKIAGSNSKDQVALLVAPYKSGDFIFDVVFCFTREHLRLALVELKLKNIEAGIKLGGTLEGLYGKPETEADRGWVKFRKWRDTSKNNFIVLNHYPPLGGELEEAYSVKYWPLQDESSKGL